MSRMVARLRWEQQPGRTSSVREVCLLGVSRPEAHWASGARLHWAGREYRVALTQDRPGESADGPRYIHLKAEPSG